MPWEFVLVSRLLPQKHYFLVFATDDEFLLTALAFLSCAMLGNVGKQNDWYDMYP